MNRLLKNMLLAIILVFAIFSFGTVLVWLNVDYPQVGLAVLILIIVSYLLYKLQKRTDSKLNRLIKRFWDLVREI